MTQEEKELLIKDLCARLPYGVKVNISASRPDLYDNFVQSINDATINYIDLNIEKCRYKEFWWDTYIVNVRPYLRPMSSMTEEERNSVENWNWNIGTKDNENALSYFDWLNKKGFDYRGLIPMGLALEAKEGMYES